ncbi:hypothetical protein ACQFYA_20845 [Promicromonospora sp. Marseille-Q5078]
MIDQPWTRVRNPAPIPEQPTVKDLRALPDDEFDLLIQSHLVPRDPSNTGRAAWDKLWLALRHNDKLADRTYDTLENFIQATEGALERGEVPEAQRKRAAKFIELCRQSWDRIDRGAPSDQPLAWAGKAGDFQPQARRVIDTLVTAIAAHRTAVLAEGPPAAADTALWETLKTVDLDPDDYASSQP